MSPISVITRACARVPALWPLTHFVASNPFAGCAELTFDEAAATMARATQSARLADAPATYSAADLIEDVDPAAGIRHAELVTEISKWCASYYDAGEAGWTMPWRDRPLWLAWKAAASIDRQPEIIGLRGFRDRVRALDDDPVAVVADVMDALDVPADARETYLLRLLMSVAGWAGHIQYRVRTHEQRGRVSDELTHLLAIRATFDRAVFEQSAAVRAHWPHAIATMLTAPVASSTSALDAREAATQLRIAPRLATATPAAPARPTMQVVTCIDVRSERLRRALEAQSPEIQTIGFAGFFGVPLAYRLGAAGEAESRCPVLIDGTAPATDAPTGDEGLSVAWQRFRRSAVSCFTFIETTGLAAVAGMFRSELRTRAASVDPSAPSLDAPLEIALPLGERVAMAANLLRQAGLTRTFAPTIVLCGHGAHTTNNPYESALACGACGGHVGDANARAAATLLNDPWVRFGLTAANIVIQADTRFVAALHDTVTDIVHTPALDPQIRAWFDAAGQAVRRERAAALGLDETLTATDAAVRELGRDWAAVRPEWGLAGNAAFIAAPRARTRHAHLNGEVFLHEYDHRADTDGQWLTQILSAPAVVAMWINLQYLVSAADPARWGSGNKLLHDVVGRLGVFEGGGGDLRAGLPWQSVHDGAALRHTPQRLSVFVEAPTTLVDTVLSRQPSVRAYFAHEWMHLLAIDPDRGTVQRWCDGEWRALPATEPAAHEALHAAGRRGVLKVDGVNQRQVLAEFA